MSIDLLYLGLGVVHGAFPRRQFRMVIDPATTIGTRYQSANWWVVDETTLNCCLINKQWLANRLIKCRLWPVSVCDLIRWRKCGVSPLDPFFNPYLCHFLRLICVDDGLLIITVCFTFIFNIILALSIITLYLEYLSDSQHLTDTGKRLG